MKWAIGWLILALGLAACVDTTLDTPSNHPANPSASPAAPVAPPAALSSGFDPFVAYASDAGPEEANAQPSARAPASDAVIYTCPMHPEISRNAPGNCPLCGMKLVPKKPANPSTP